MIPVYQRKSSRKNKETFTTEKKKREYDLTSQKSDCMQKG